MALITTIPSRRLIAIILASAVLTISLSYILLQTELRSMVVDAVSPSIDEPATPDAEPDKPAPTPKYKPTPAYTPPPVKDPFPLLATSSPPPIPEWNRPRQNLHKDYDLPVPPPVLIGFTRSWPILLQAVVSYVTAGWPLDQIYVIENTGTQQANPRGQLSLQNPFYLNHTVLDILGVNVIQTPVLLSFAQLQNFYLSLSYSHNWPYYFWSHMDVMVLSYEDGGGDKTVPYYQPGYQSLYELACRALRDARKKGDKWGLKFFSYDHLALVNPAAFEDVGGWDTLIPYYVADCDMHSRLAMRGWSQEDARAGIITDVSTALDDLLALYRDPNIVPSFSDPNPPPPPPPLNESEVAKRDDLAVPDVRLEYWRSLLRTADGMFHYKHGGRGRNTWQTAQRGGEGEPFYYDAAGLARGIDIITEAGKEVYHQKWGHHGCDLVSGGGLQFADQWKVEHDWE